MIGEVYLGRGGQDYLLLTYHPTLLLYRAILLSSLDGTEDEAGNICR